MKRLVSLALFTLPALAAEPPSFGGIYPQLASFNQEGECGTGAVVPWAGSLWVITYGPHLPFGSSDKLYEITPSLRQIIRPESVGGTPANRMIHRESKQLVIGPYFIDEQHHVRAISPKLMPGRLTGSARHLSDPANKVYFATMEEGLYEVDVHTLEVTGLIKDGNKPKPGQTEEKSPATISSTLPGYHGKGLYTGQGRVIYANNGEHGKDAETNPNTASGALGEFTGQGNWNLIRRNQFTEVTGPGGISGADHPDTDPVWSIGWDFRSLILMVLDGGAWHSYRLPKASHCYDGAHGWNTEWPRIREIGENDLLMTMHGMFWRFPKSFSATHSAGIRPRSTYLKVIGDFCRWNDLLVFGCDDTAKSAFLNSNAAKNLLAGPGQSQSNLWFTEPSTPDHLGPALGRGAVWSKDKITAGQTSDPYLFAGFSRRCLYLSHDMPAPVAFTLETDAKGDNTWNALRTVTVPAHGSLRVEFSPADHGEWIRIKPDHDCTSASAVFQYSNQDMRTAKADTVFDGIASITSAPASTGLMRARGHDAHTLFLAADNQPGDPASGTSFYQLDGDMRLTPFTGTPASEDTALGTALPKGKLSVEPASVVYTDPAGHPWRLPKGDPAFDKTINNPKVRALREVSTERFILNCHGTIYEVPADNAGGFPKIRPVASHNKLITDFASYRGLLVLTGIKGGEHNQRVIRSADGHAAAWAGAFDELWKLGKPAGTGGPWLDTPVKADVPSDPYLFAGYDKKSLTLSQSGKSPVAIRVELDISGDGQWIPYQTIQLPPGGSVKHDFPDSCMAYWVRLTPSADTTATARFQYN